MHTRSIEPWLHEHTFGQQKRKFGERRTLIVIAITVLAMIVEIVSGLLFGSMALLADGLHMGSHASALSISAFAYFYTRRHAADPRFNFGTGKVNSLAAFASAVLLVVFALVMAWGSIQRFLSPVTIDFNKAIAVAVLGLVVNGGCIIILRRGRHHDRHQEDEHSNHAGSAHRHEDSDHSLWSAYMHVLADALTSLLAIFALLGGKYLGQNWLDPFMGVVGAALVSHWSLGLIRASCRVLLDMEAPEPVRRAVREAIEQEGDNRVSDLHLWAVGPSIYAAEIALVTTEPRSPDHYAQLVPADLPLVHMTVEVHRCPSHESPASAPGVADIEGASPH